MLTEFDSHYINPGYASSFDTLEGINEAGISAAAALLARTLLKLSHGDAADLNVRNNILKHALTVSKMSYWEVLYILLKQPGLLHYMRSQEPSLTTDCLQGEIS